MQSEGVRLKPVGGMDSDSGYLDIKNGNYISAKNIRHLTDEGQSTFEVQNVKGNKYLVTIPTATKTRKQQRIYVDKSGMNGTGTETWSITLVNSIGTVVASGTFAVDGSSVSTTTTNIQNAINTMIGTLSGWSVSYAIQSSGDKIAVDVLVNAANQYAEYNFYIYPPSNNLCDNKVYTIQEAINDGHTGLLRPIAGYEIDNDVFLLSTTKDFMPSILEGIYVTGATNATPIVVTTNAAHGLTSGQAAIMTFENVQGNTATNGTWLCVYVSATQLKLIHSSGNGAFTTSADSTITTDVESVSEIGVLQRNTNTDTSTYTTLLRTTKLGLRSCNMIDLRGETSPDKKSLYWTDDNEPIRCFYYKGAYVRGGAIFDIFSNPNGQYTYESLNDETKLILSNTNAVFGLNKVYQSGGANLSGNHIQFVRFITDSLSDTDWIGPGNPVNIYQASYSDIYNNEDAKKIFGDDALVQTSKIIELYIRNIPPIFKYVEVADVIYSGNDSVPAKTIVLPRVLLNGESEINVKIIGSEVGTDLDIGTLNRITANYDVAKNIRIMQNRLVISNLKTPEMYDFTNWFQTFKHVVDHWQLPSIENNLNGINYGNPQKYNVGEYQQEENVHNFLGYMMNETYRFFGVVEFKNGSLSQGYWIDDIKIDCDTTPSRRLSALAHYRYSASTVTTTPDGTVVTTRVMVPYVKFMGFNINETIGGKRIRDIVKRIHIYRCPVDNPTVLASGFVVPCVTGWINSSNGGSLKPENEGLTLGTTIIEYPWIGDNNDITYDVPNSLSYPGPSLSAPLTSVFTAKRRYGSFYSWDIMSGLQNIEPSSTDKLIVIGQPNRDAAFPVLTDNDSGNTFVKYSGITDTNNDPSSTQKPDELSILEGAICDSYGTVRLNSGADTIVKNMQMLRNISYWAALVGVTTILRCPKSLILRTSADINPVTSPGSDNGFYIAQYYRPRTDQYGDKSTNKIVPTGAYLEITDQTPALIMANQNFNVFGGDTFTNTCFLKMQYHEEWKEDTANYSKYPASQTAVRFFMQNKANFSMRFKSMTNKKDGSEPLTDNYPNTLVKYYDAYLTELESYFNGDGASEPLGYNKGYSARGIFDLFAKRAFNANEIVSNDEPTTTAWSPKKVAGSNVDSYRNFLPLDKKILDFNFGEIMGMETANGEIFTFQPKEFKRHFFNTDGMFTTKDGTEVITGSGAVMSRRELDLSRYGSSNKWSIIKGSTISGKDAVYWISGVHKKVLKHDPSQGTTVISDVQNFESFTYNNLKWTIQWDSPIIYGGISAVWNPRYSEAIWVVKARRDMPGWVLPDDPSTAYDTGAVVYFLNPSSKRTNPIGALWISLIDNNMNMPPDPGSPSPYWQEIPHTNTDYYNEWTFVFNEKNNSFTNFRSWGSPLLISAWDTFLSTDPSNANRADIYAHNEGEYCRWYSNGYSEIYEDGYIEMAINRYPSLTKTFEAIMCSCKVPPFKVEFWTEKHYSYLLESDFEKIEDGYWSPIKNDATVTAENPDGRNDIDTESLWGQYLRVKFHFEKGVQQSLKNITVKIQGNNRNDNQ